MSQASVCNMDSTRDTPPPCRDTVLVTVATLLFFLLSVSITLAQASDRPELAADNGAIAKLQFELKDDMPVTSIVWSPDGKYIAASSTQGNKIHVWDVEKKKRVHEFERTAAAPFFNELSWSSSGRYLAACDGYRGGLRLYDIHSWQAAHLIQPIREKRCVASTFSRDGQELAVLGESISFYSTDDWRLLRFVDLPNSVSHGVPYRFRVIGYVSQSHTILIGGDRRDGSNGFKVALGHVWVLDASDEIPRRDFPAYKVEPPSTSGNLISLAISPDGAQVATGTTTGDGSEALGFVTASVHILRVSDGVLLGAPLDGLSFGHQQGLIYTPDGRYLIVAHGGINIPQAIHIIDAKTLQVRAVVHAGSSIYGLTARPDSSQFAVGAGSSIFGWSLKNND